MSKFKVGDHVRVTAPMATHFDEVGAVVAITEPSLWPVKIKMLKEMAYNQTLAYKESALTLADSDVHTVLDQMDAESAPAAFKVGERVMVRGHVGSYGGRFGEVAGSEDDGAIEWLVRLDGDEGVTPFSEDELLRGKPAVPVPDTRGMIDPKSDPVSHPAHYTSHPSGIECLTITRHMGFNLGNAMKYVWRADLKGAAIQDLEKAAFYIADEITKRKAAQ